MKVSVRMAGEKDINNMAAYISELFDIEGAFSPDRKKHEQGLKIILNSKGLSAAFVAESGSRIVGMVTGQLNVSTAAGGLSLLVEDLIVDRDMRGKGVGELLMNAVFKWAKARKVLRVSLLVDENNEPAISFYRKKGFKGSCMTGMYLYL